MQTVKLFKGKFSSGVGGSKVIGNVLQYIEHPFTMQTMTNKYYTVKSLINTETANTYKSKAHSLIEELVTEEQKHLTLDTKPK